MQHNMKERPMDFCFLHVFRLGEVQPVTSLYIYNYIYILYSIQWIYCALVYSRFAWFCLVANHIFHPKIGCDDLRPAATHHISPPNNEIPSGCLKSSRHKRGETRFRATSLWCYLPEMIWYGIWYYMILDMWRYSWCLMQCHPETRQIMAILNCWITCP